MLQEIRVYELCDRFEKALIERNYGQDGMYRYCKSMKSFKKFTGDVVFTPQLSAAFLTKILGEGEGFSQKGIGKPNMLGDNDLSRNDLEFFPDLLAHLMKGLSTLRAYLFIR